MVKKIQIFRGQLTEKQAINLWDWLLFELSLLLNTTFNRSINKENRV